MNGIEKIIKSLSNRATLHTIKDSKYKTDYLSIYFTLPLTKENASYTALLSRLLYRGCEKYPTMADITNTLLDNYQSNIAMSSMKNGENQVFYINLSSMKDDYAPKGEKVFKTALDILSEMLFKPLIKNGGFLEEYVISEKKNTIDAIKSEINNKGAYSKKKFCESMFEGEAYSNSINGYDTIVGLADGKSIYGFYLDLINNAPCDIYYVGEKSIDEIESILPEELFKDSNSIVRVPGTVRKFDVTEVKTVTEKMSITQGHLWVGFRANTSYSSENYLAYALMNMVLGGDVTSKMFMNIREKLSLCYTCYSSIDSVKGALFCYAGIDFKNKEKTLNELYHQLDEIKKGNISDSELEDAKKAYSNRIKEVMDNPSLMPLWYFLRENAGAARNPAEDAENIFKVTAEDVKKCAGELVLDTVYFLTGEAEK